MLLCSELEISNLTASTTVMPLVNSTISLRQQAARCVDSLLLMVMITPTPRLSVMASSLDLCVMRTINTTLVRTGQ